MPEAGAVFGIVWLASVVPASVVALVLFYQRRSVQPIKARYPALVVLSGTILILYMILLCCQRIVGDSYPCLLNLWSGYIGTIVLCNCYVIRCWTLYFNYRLTMEKLKHSDAVAPPGEDSFFRRWRRFTDLATLFQLAFAVTVVLLIPAAVYTGVDYDELVHSGGDSCEKKWPDIILAIIVAGYVVVFMAFALNLRQVVDGFKLKEELRFTGIVAIIAVIPWVVFNNAAESVNNDVFPFSTLSVLIAALSALAASTYWPLYRSVYKPPALTNLAVPENINTLAGLLVDPLGFQSFKDFLTQEFSVENILFFAEVSAYRKAVRERSKSSAAALGEAQAIYAKYIIRGAPFEVNLPDDIVRDIQARLKNIFAAHKQRDDGRSDMDPSPRSNHKPSANRIVSSASAGSAKDALLPNGPASSAAAGAALDDVHDPFVEQLADIFVRAEKNIFDLMESDSYKRYLASPAFQLLSRQFEQRQKKLQVLMEMEVI